jgi:hypothetical protein
MGDLNRVSFYRSPILNWIFIHGKITFIILSLFLCLLLALKPARAAIEEDVIVNPQNLSGYLINKDGYFLPRGMLIQAEMRTPIDTRHSKVGDLVTMQATVDIFEADYAIIPVNSFLHGYISKLEGPGRLFRKPKVEITFDKITIPGEQKPRKINITGLVETKQFRGNAKNVTYGTPYGTKSKIAAGLGGVLAFATTSSAIAFIEPYATFGIESLLNRITVLGATGAGATAGAASITRDDLRIDSGTKMNVILTEPSYTFAADTVPELPNNLTDKMPEERMTLMEEYERLREMKSERL